MNMKISMKNCLCKTYRAAGLPKDKALILVNEVDKWYRSNGVEWTVERMKSLHHWYITKLGGVPNIPSWMAHKGGYPKGPFKWVFQMKNVDKAIVILSAHTIFFNETVTKTQLRKLNDGLRSARVQNVVKGRGQINTVPKLNYASPTLECLTGVSIPAGRRVIHLENPRKWDQLADAYMQSWLQIPCETAKFLRDAGLTMHGPKFLWEELDQAVGTVSCIQEPSLKARWISNPNRITQHFLSPLGREWAMQLERHFPINDCTRKQISGAEWAQSKLKQGVTLAAVDLTSATDKLNLEPCLDVLHYAFYGSGISQDNGRQSWQDSPDGNRYLAAVDHFVSVSRGRWLFRGESCKWEVGWPLGTTPSFPLLGAVNCLTAGFSCREVGLDPKDSFRVLGDDLVIDARASDGYCKRISRLGGVVNPNKTFTSSKAVEFAGLVIDRQSLHLKRVKARDVSDNSFMLLMSCCGEQAKWLLRPRQRRVWNELKYVPGVAVEGSYPRHSFGEPLDLRYQWYLSHVANPNKDKDKDIVSPKQMALQLVIALKKQSSTSGGVDRIYSALSQSITDNVVPQDIWEGVQPSFTAFIEAKRNDPRLVNGATTLQGGESILEKDTFKSYQAFKTDSQVKPLPGRAEEQSLVPKPTPTRKGQGRSR